MVQISLNRLPQIFDRESFCLVQSRIRAIENHQSDFGNSIVSVCYNEKIFIGCVITRENYFSTK